jgi:HlyD family secretion protein
VPVDATTPIAGVANLDSLEASVDLSEFDVAPVKPGQAAVVSVDALGGKPFNGKVVFAALTGVDSGTIVTFPVRISLPSTRSLRPGMSVSVRITVAERRDVVRVPLEAVSEDGEGAVVTVVDEESGETSERRVELGIQNNKVVEIVKGLRAGEHVELVESAGGGASEEE